MRNFSKPDLWCLIMTWKKRNATTGKGCFVFLAWSGFSCKRKTWVPLSETKKKKQANNQCQGFFGKDLSATNFQKTNQYSPPIKYRKNFSPFFDLKTSHVHLRRHRWLWAARSFFKGVSHGNHQKWLRVDFDEFQSPMHPQHHHFFSNSQQKNLWFSGWQFWDQINPW